MTRPRLCRRRWVAVVTLGSTPNTDILVSDSEGNQFVNIFVRPGTPAKRSTHIP